MLEGVDVRPGGELLPDLAGPLPEDLVGEGLGDHHHQLLLGEGDHLHPLHHNGLEADDQVHPAVGQLVLQVGGVALKQGKFHHGKLRLELGEDFRQEGQAAGVGDAHPEHPHVVAVDVAHLGQKLAVQVQDLGGRLHQKVAGVGEGQLGGAGEQLHVQLLLHVADVVAQGLLGDEQTLRRPGDVQLLGYKQEIFQVQKIHRCSFRLLNDILHFHWDKPSIPQ